jgi:hypothetical protein
MLTHSRYARRVWQLVPSKPHRAVDWLPNLLDLLRQGSPAHLRRRMRPPSERTSSISLALDCRALTSLFTQFFVKTHFPALPKLIKPGDARFKNYYKEFDQVVHVVRNPLDSLVSWWHLSHAPRTPEGAFASFPPLLLFFRTDGLVPRQQASKRTKARSTSSSSMLSTAPRFLILLSDGGYVSFPALPLRSFVSLFVVPTPSSSHPTAALLT